MHADLPSSGVLDCAHLGDRLEDASGAGHGLQVPTALAAPASYELLAKELK